MLVLGINGSLRSGSHNGQLLRAAGQAMPAGTSFKLFRGLASVPPYNEDEEAPEVVTALRDEIRAADAVLFATPEYNHSVPGQLKNALDWVSRPFPGNALRDKPVAVVGASTGLFGAVWAQAELRKILGAIGAEVVDLDLAVGRAGEAFDDQGQLADSRLHSRLAEVVDTLLERAARRALACTAPMP